MTALREVFASFGIEFDRQGNLQRGDRQVSRTVQSLRRVGPAAARAAAGIAAVATAAGGAMAAGLGHIVSSTIDAQRELDRWTNRLSINRDSLQAWIELGREFQLETDDVTDALKELQLKAMDAITDRTGTQAEEFRRVGISIEDLSANVNDADSLMRMFAQRLDSVTNAADRNRIVDELMSDAGTRFLDVLNLGSREINRRRTAIHQTLGSTDELSAAVQRHSMMMIEATRQWTRWRREITAMVLPLIERAVRIVQEWREPIMRVVRETNILKGALIGLGVVAAAVAALTIASWGPVVLTVVAVAAAVAGIAVAYDQLSRSVDGAKTALSEYLDAEGRLGEGGTEGLLLLLGDAWDRLTTRLVNFYEALQPVISALQMVLRVWQAVTTLGMSEILGESGFNVLGAAGDETVERVGAAARRRSAGRRAERERTLGREVVQEEHERRMGRLATVDAAGLPMSVPGVTAAPAPEARSTRQSVRNQTSISAPMTVDLTVNEATDAEAVTRRVRTEIETAQTSLIRELEAMVTPQEQTVAS